MSSPTVTDEAISVFDMLKIGVGPSSSHTLGPWRALQRWLAELASDPGPDGVAGVRLELYGSLGQTGRGHATDTALCLALLGHDPETVPVDRMGAYLQELRDRGAVVLPGSTQPTPFDPDTDIVFHKEARLPKHANGMRFTWWPIGGSAAAQGSDGFTSTWYSIGGGFVLREGEQPAPPGKRSPLPYPCRTAADLAEHCRAHELGLVQLVRANEAAWRSEEDIRSGLLSIWHVMRDGIYRGCHTEGSLPGGLGVTRRAAAINRRLLGEHTEADVHEWMAAVRGSTRSFRNVMKWTSCFALAVNEENACLGRVVTAPTNGAAGVIPAVLMHHICFADHEVHETEVIDFLLVAGELGTLFKKGATISAAMGGCQAEIGVSSAMAAGALAAVRGCSVGQALMATEIAMEHHLGMTCDPVGGLVQVPCIERNAMGAVKAINAAELAGESDPALARVSLDDVIRTMWETARDMREQYKETSAGGLAVNISVRIPEC
jgi:L-serine dehydratase